MRGIAFVKKTNEVLVANTGLNATLRLNAVTGKEIGRIAVPFPIFVLYDEVRRCHAARAPCGGRVLEKPIVPEYPLVLAISV